jgi:hypothetical protein
VKVSLRVRKICSAQLSTIQCLRLLKVINSECTKLLISHGEIERWSVQELSRMR